MEAGRAFQIIAVRIGNEDAKRFCSGAHRQGQGQGAEGNETGLTSCSGKSSWMSAGLNQGGMPDCTRSGITQCHTD
ncbi:jg22706 [Pararge aegeria aegeria]|uniref:Jg22706 protein n=1 Tax=Pararge aegeria aegeria TaxID=348720 RepID=A0A8S4RP55_9NEOP|nr:jg22706 [Pararge aegeria aegeria]